MEQPVQPSGKQVAHRLRDEHQRNQKQQCARRHFFVRRIQDILEKCLFLPQEYHQIDGRKAKQIADPVGSQAINDDIGQFLRAAVQQRRILQQRIHGHADAADHRRHGQNGDIDEHEGRDLIRPAADTADILCLFAPLLLLRGEEHHGRLIMLSRSILRRVIRLRCRLRLRRRFRDSGVVLLFQCDSSVSLFYLLYSIGKSDKSQVCCNTASAQSIPSTAAERIPPA